MLPTIAGYGPYVWSAYLLTLAALIGEVVLLAVRHRQASASRKRGGAWR